MQIVYHEVKGQIITEDIFSYPAMFIVFVLFIMAFNGILFAVHLDIYWSSLLLMINLSIILFN